MIYGVGYVDGEIPVRVGAQLFLKGIPDADANGVALQLFRNGLLMHSAFNDYTLAAGQIIIPNPPPDDQDKFIAYYRERPR